MAPCQTEVTTEQRQVQPNDADIPKKDNYTYKVEIVWRNVIIFAYLHLTTLYTVYMILTGQMMWQSFLFYFIYLWCSGTGITAGAHRLWAHKSYKARWPLRLFLAYFEAAAFQNHIWEWVRDHRVHHKYCDTDADPHNSKRGFFFSHIGWLLVRKHRDVKAKGKTIDMSDLEKDWVVMLQKKYYMPLMLTTCFVIPTIVPWYFWNESFKVAYFGSLARYTINVNITWLVNSAAHMWGDRPFDQTATSRNNLFVGIVALGEGWHNYHHAFPWDYRASELWNINSTTTFIKLCAKLGLAYELKETSDEMIKRRALRTGDGTDTLAFDKLGKTAVAAKRDNHHNNHNHNHHEGELWGYGDKDMTPEERELIIITNKKEK